MSNTVTTLDNKEMALVTFIIKVRVEEENKLVWNRYDISEKMVDAWPKEYGKDRLGKVAQESGMSRDTLKKCYPLAKHRTREQVELLQGTPFPLSYRLILKSLTLDFEEVLAIHRASDRPKDFEDEVGKRIKERDEKAKAAQKAQEAKTDESADGAATGETPPEDNPPAEEKLTKEQEALLKAEVQKTVADLYSTITRKNQEISALRQQLAEKESYIAKLEAKLMPSEAA